MDRELSGIFVRAKVDGKYENKDITDCDEAQIRACMEGRSAEELIGWVVTLCKAFKEMGDDCDIIAGENQWEAT